MKDSEDQKNKLLGVFLCLNHKVRKLKVVFQIKT